MLRGAGALYRGVLRARARRFFELAVTVHPRSAEAVACVGYAAHRLGDEGGALHWLRRALELDRQHAEARIYPAHLLHDRREYEAALVPRPRPVPGAHFRRPAPCPL